ncbi:glycoside hydrolase family 127 protein [Echinicola shivajiensis]|uniref:glycoside hydrolase family 127 protein n=1 Tax=Echinicola shivajiensis TaxID=1035916 RepID=UPI001BFC93AF|nr:glycoside hydrolase family 127 protein [Echinicola shivajiensis]
MNHKITYLTALALLVLPLQSSLAQSPARSVELFDLEQVTLLPSPFLNAQEVDKAYILEMDVDRLLAPYMLEAGIEWQAERYGNWENTGLDGHIGGHYLSALSMMYASTGDLEIKGRMDYMVEQLALAQDRNGNGYLGGIPGGMAMWKEISEGNIDAGGFSLNQKWVPLYNIHKIYAGLRDAYWIGGNQQAKEMLVELSDWFYDLTKDLSQDQFQQMLISEHGGMNEVFADVAAITGDMKYLELAKKMSHQILLEPLEQGKDELTGMHANTQIPKVVGFQRIAQEGDLAEWQNAAEFFWNTVTQNRSVAIGGNSVREHFHPANDFSAMVSSEQGPETCNTYNMLRLSEQLYLSNPSAKYVDFYERGLYNHILSSQHPEKGGFVYFTPMRPGHYRVYSQPHEGFWCCVGSGLENHAKYGEFIYAHTKDELYINLFIPSQLNWQEQGLELTQSTSFPEKEESQFTLKLDKPKKLKLKFRYPAWVKAGSLEIELNGKLIEVNAQPSSYIELERKWKDGDHITIKLPMEMSWEALPDGSAWGAFVYGPIVLAAEEGKAHMAGLFADDSRMGHVASGKMWALAETPLLVSESNDPTDELEPVSNEALTFKMLGDLVPQQEEELILRPFYEIHESRYQIYWPIAKKEKVEEVKAMINKKDGLMLALERRTVDQVATGEQQPESDHFFKGQQTQSGNDDGYFWRSTSAWFSYELKNSDFKAKALRITFPGEVKGNTFDIYINDQLFKKEQLVNIASASQALDYELPEGLQKEEKLVIKFQALEGRPTEKIYYVRLLK